VDGNDGSRQEAAGSHACTVSEGQDWVSPDSRVRSRGGGYGRD
jgi:hypothetical protein